MQQPWEQKPFPPDPPEADAGVEEAPPAPQDAGSWREDRRLPLILFLATVLTTLFAGALQAGVNVFLDPRGLVSGVPFSFTLLFILGSHEMGHYLTSKHHGVRASLPYFIPFPSFIGTMGAFIRMRPPIPTKRVLLDIGVAGPIVGFIVSVGAVILGLRYSVLIPEEGLEGIQLGNSLIFGFLSLLVLGPIPAGHDVLLHPVAFAGWIGFFVTALNLLPIGQLDGGHIAYSVLGRRSESLAYAIVVLLVLIGVVGGWPGWFLWAILATVIGFRHPPVVAPLIPLDRMGRMKAAMALAMLVVTFTPVPFS